MSTATPLVCTTRQNGQDRNFNLVRPLQLSQVSNAAPTMFAAINPEPIAVAVVVEFAVEKIPLVMRLSRSGVNLLGPKTHSGFFPLVALRRLFLNQQSDTPLRFGSNRLGTGRNQTDTKQRY